MAAEIVRRLAAALLLAVPPPRSTPTRSQHAKPGFEIAVHGDGLVDDDLEQALLPIKWMLAFYIGGMGAKEKNFHLNLIERLGFGDEADERAGALPRGQARRGGGGGARRARRRDLARRPAGRASASASQAWKASPVTTLLCGTRDANALKVIAEAVR